MPLSSRNCSKSTWTLYENKEQCLNPFSYSHSINISSFVRSEVEKGTHLIQVVEQGPDVQPTALPVGLGGRLICKTSIAIEENAIDQEGTVLSDGVDSEGATLVLGIYIYIKFLR